MKVGKKRSDGNSESENIEGPHSSKMSRVELHNGPVYVLSKELDPTGVFRSFPLGARPVDEESEVTMVDEMKSRHEEKVATSGFVEAEEARGQLVLLDDLERLCDSLGADPLSGDWLNDCIALAKEADYDAKSAHKALREEREKRDQAENELRTNEEVRLRQRERISELEGEVERWKSTFSDRAEKRISELEEEAERWKQEGQELRKLGDMIFDKFGEGVVGERSGMDVFDTAKKLLFYRSDQDDLVKLHEREIEKLMGELIEVRGKLERASFEREKILAVNERLRQSVHRIFDRLIDEGLDPFSFQSDSDSGSPRLSSCPNEEQVRDASAPCHPPGPESGRSRTTAKQSKIKLEADVLKGVSEFLGGLQGGRVSESLPEIQKKLRDVYEKSGGEG